MRRGCRCRAESEWERQARRHAGGGGGGGVDTLAWAKLFVDGHLSTSLFRALVEGFRAKALPDQAAGVMLDALTRMARARSLFPVQPPATEEEGFAWMAMAMACSFHPNASVRVQAQRLCAGLSMSGAVTICGGEDAVLAKCFAMEEELGFQFDLEGTAATLSAQQTPSVQRDPISLGGFSSTLVRTDSDVCPYTCAHCASKSQAKLKLCGGCKTAAYCSAACQKAHWKGHKGMCRSVQARRRSIKGQARA